ncbi:MAG TPA: hypothetical protein VFH58_04515 [Acidimicrobiales bacterium]|nr:hypothetical protein [Acidimicrobiales bacterium]
MANGLRFMWVLTWPDEVLLHGPEGYREAMRQVGQLVRRLRGTGSPSPTSTALRSTPAVAAGM